MFKLIKRIRFIISLLVVLAVLAVVAVVLFADKAVQTAVETAGTKTLNVGVTVGKADAHILRGAVDLRDIRVANPPGYEGPALLKLQRVDVTADTRSLLSSQVLIKDMKLDGMEVFVDQKGLENNLYEVIKPLREPHKPTGKSLIVDNLEITNTTVHVSLTGVPGESQSADFVLDKITMTELGRNEKIDTAALIGKILLAVAAGVAQRGGDILPQETIGEMSEILDKAIDIGKIIFGPGKTDPNRKDTQDLGKSITEGLKGILGGQKKQ